MPDKPVRLAARKVEGDPNLPPIIFVHGNGSTKDTWQVILEDDNRPSNTLYAIDLRGHGESKYVGDDFSLEAMNRDILHFLKAEQIERCFIVAHSMGARISIHFCAQNPEVVEGLMMVDMEMLPRPPHVASEDELDRMINIGREHPNIESVKSALTNSGCYSKSKVAKIMRNDSKVQRRGDGSCYLGTSPYVDYLTHNQIQTSDDGRYSFAKAAIQDYPVTLVYADDDSSVTQEGLQEMQGAMPRLECTLIPNTFHSVHKAQPDLFLEELSNFLTRASARIVRRQVSGEGAETETQSLEPQGSASASSCTMMPQPPAPPPPLLSTMKASRPKSMQSKEADHARPSVTSASQKDSISSGSLKKNHKEQTSAKKDLSSVRARRHRLHR